MILLGVDVQRLVLVFSRRLSHPCSDATRILPLVDHTRLGVALTPLAMVLLLILDLRVLHLRPKHLLLLIPFEIGRAIGLRAPSAGPPRSTARPRRWWIRCSRLSKVLSPVVLCWRLLLLFLQLILARSLVLASLLVVERAVIVAVCVG